MSKSEFSKEVMQNVYELKKKYIGKRFCIFKGTDRGHIGVCRWIEPKSLQVDGETYISTWYRIEVECGDGLYYPKRKSYWAREDQIIRIQDEPDEVPYYSGW